MGATLRAPIAVSSQMLGTIGAVVNLDVHADTKHDLALEAGTEASPLSFLNHYGLSMYLPATRKT